MIYLFDNPKSSSWTISRATFPDTGSVIYVDLVEEWSTKYLMSKQIRLRGAVVEQVKNFVFEARLMVESVTRGTSSITYRFVDSENVEQSFYGGANSLLEFLKAMHSREIVVDSQGFFYGKFTFRKNGDNIYIYPYRE